MNKIIKWLLIIYFVLNAQSHIQTSTDTYRHFCLIDFRNIIGYTLLEWSILGLIIFLGWINRNKKPAEWHGFLHLFLVLGAISVFSTLLLTDDKMLGIRTSFIYLRPFILFLIVSSFKWNLKDVISTFNVLKVIFIINLVISYIQMIGLNYRIDNLSGMMDDAHTFAFMVYTIVLYLLIQYWITKKWKYLILILPALIPALAASADKMTVFIIPTIFIVYIIVHQTSIKVVLRTFFGVLTIGIFVSIVIDNLQTLFIDTINGVLWRLQPFLRGNLFSLLSRVRVFEGYGMLPYHYFQYPSAFVIGVGPGMYGSSEVIAQFFNVTSANALNRIISSPLKNFALGGSFASHGISAFGTGLTAFASSDYIVLLMEFGLVFTILYFIYWKRIYELLQVYRNSGLSKQIESLVTTILGVFIFLALLGIITFQDGIIKSSNIYPAMILFGMLFRAIPTNGRLPQIRNIIQ